MKKIFFNISIFFLISKALGFVREIVLSYYYGASYITDAALVSFMLPEMVFGMAITGIGSSYIPILCEIEKKDGRESGVDFTNNVIRSICVVITLFVVIFLFHEGFF